MNTYDSTFYKLVVTPFAVDVQPKFDESGSSDRMFKYIKRNGRYTAFQKLYHNEVTNNYILVGFDFKDIG